VGTFLRSFTWGHALQLDAVSRHLLAHAWGAGVGPGAQPLTIDLDSTICETYGLKKAGGAGSATPTCGATTPCSPWPQARARSCMPAGGAVRPNTSRGVSRFIAQTVQRVREAGARGEITLGADSGFCSHKVVRPCHRRDVRFSITIPLHKRLHQTIAALPEEAWIAISYVLPGAGVAEIPYTPFGKKGTPVRLIVRRVPPNPGSQLALFSACGYHAFICDRKGDTLYLEQDHRRHAEIENVIRDLKYGVGLNHLPSGKFGANAAWLAFQVMAYNVGLWVNSLGLHGTPLWMKTLRHRFLALPGRLTRSARRFFGGPKAASACLALEKNPVAPVPPLLEPCIGRPAASPQTALSRRWPPSASGKSIARSREGRPLDSG